MNSSSFSDAVEDFGLMILESGEVVVRRQKRDDNNRLRLAAAIREAKKKRVPYQALTDILFHTFQESLITAMSRIDHLSRDAK